LIHFAAVWGGRRARERQDRRKRGKHMNRNLLIAAALAAAGTALAFAPAATTLQSLQLTDVTAKPIPPGYNFPTPTATIDQWVAASNTTAMRGHAWDLWAGMTSDSGEVYEGKQLPVWETWYGKKDVFTPASPLVAGIKASNFLATHRRSMRDFVQPLQFTDTGARMSLLALLGPADTRVVSFTKFSPEAAAFIMSPQAGPGGKTYRYNSKAGLSDLNNSWPAGTASQDRGIAAFPNEGIETKNVFNLVKATGLTALPLWQGPAASTNPANPLPGTWTTCVLIDPNGTSSGVRPATPQEITGAYMNGAPSCKTFLYGSLSLLYSFKMTADEASAFQTAQRNNAAQMGDYAVLVAMHVNSREIAFWTWQTFYWQPGSDTPNGFPGSKAGQPASVKAPWTNYASCVNYDQTTTPGGSTMVVCFNPYLETAPSIPSGVASNCMSCHGTARFPVIGPKYPASYRAPIKFFTDPAYFNAANTHTDFSWAVADAP